MGVASSAFHDFLRCLDLEGVAQPTDPRDVYELSTEIGKGAIGRVVRVIPKRAAKNSVPLCAKIIDSQKAIHTASGQVHGLTQEEITKLLSDEIRSLQKVKGCRYIVTFIDSFDLGSESWIITELCTVGNLVEMLRRIRFDEDDQLAVLFSVLQAANYMHNLGLVHSDIKLENLVVDEGGVIKLCDFGGACDCETDGYAKNRFPGTMPYVPPEILSGYVPDYATYYSHPRFHQKRDVWSIGVLALKLEDGESRLDLLADMSGPHGLFTAVSFGYDVESFLKRDFLMFYHPQDVSEEHRSFVTTALVVDLGERLTTPRLLEHRFISQTNGDECKMQVLEFVRRFREAPEPTEQDRGRLSDVFEPVFTS